MPRSPTTGDFVRVTNSFSQPVYGTVIDPTDAIALFDDYDVGLTFDDASPLILAGSTSGVLTQLAPDVAGTSVLTWPAGTTDFSATGGAGQFVKQASAGAPFTVSTVSASELVGPVPLDIGGTNANLTASNGGIFYSTATAGAILSGTATANLPLLSASSSAPVWAVISYPTSANNGGIPYFSSASAISSSATLGSGQILLGGGSGSPPTTSANASVSSGALSLGANASVLGSVKLFGNTSGDVTIKPAAIAGTATVFQVPADNGTNGYVLQTNGSGVTSWVNPTSGGTVTSVAAGTGMSFSTITTTGSVAIDKATAANYYAAASNKVVTTDIIYPAEVTVTYGTTTTFDFDTFINAAVTLTGNITTMTFSNIRAGKAGAIRFIQDGSGNHTTVWNSNLKWAGGSTPTLSTAAGAVDVLVYQTISSSYIVASLLKAVA